MKPLYLFILWVGLLLMTGLYSVAQDKYVQANSADTLTTQDVDVRDKNGAATEPVTMRTIPDSTIHRLKQDDDFAYANDPAYWSKQNDGGQGAASKSNWFMRALAAILQSKGFKYFVFLVLAAILGYALYKIMAENNWRIFERSSSKSGPGAGLDEEMAEEDLEGIWKALQDKDFRMSVRYLFLKSLYLLNEQGMIRLRLQATNREYIDEIKDYPQAGSFKYLENAYDHVWYGGFILSEHQFEWLHQYFEDFYKSLES